jgi:predicted amidohydrolase YtcJ
MATTLLRGGRVLSTARPRATALLTDGAAVRWVGTDDCAPAADRVVELDGAFVAPAFVDAHVHATQTGLALSGLDLSGARSLAQALDAVHAESRRLRGRVVLGTGWDETRWPEHRPPTPAELDRASYGGVVYLARVDHHSAVVSSALLAAAPQARSLSGWSGSGHLALAAHHAVRGAAYGSITPAQRQAAQRGCRAHAAALGIGCLHEMSGPQICGGAADLESLLRLAADEPGPEVIGYWGALEPGRGNSSGSEPAGVSTAGALATVARLGLAGAAGDLFCDGSFGSHTAALSAPYADAPGTTGHLWHGVEELADHIAACTRAGVQAGFHAIGDAALQAVLDGMAKAAEQVGLAALVAARHRIEHAEMPPSGPGAAGARVNTGAAGARVNTGAAGARVNTGAAGARVNTAAGGAGGGGAEGVAAFARFGLVASVQPAFDAFWGGPDGMYAERLGVARAAGLNPFAAFVAAGVPLAFGSDAPVTPLDPWGGVRAAVHHHTEGSRIWPYAAFAAATVGGWQAARRDGEGELVPGAPATYAVWQTGELGDGGLPDLTPGVPLPTCLRTVLRGTTIYER